MAKKNKRVAIQAFTGSGKTEMMAIVYPLWFLFHNPKKEVLIVSKSLKQAISIIDRIVQTVEENELLQSLIPNNLKKGGNWYSRGTSGARISFTKYRKIFVAPYSENIRGYHVDLVIADEVSSYQNKEIWGRFVTTRVNSKNGSVFAISTPDNPTDLMQELINNEVYVSDTFKIYNKQGESVWPERFSLERIEEIYKELGHAKFEKEYMCNARAESEGAIFSSKHLMKGVDVSIGYEEPYADGMCFIGADFAVSNGPRSDFDVYILVEKVNGKIVIRDMYRGRGIPVSEKIRILDNMCNKYPITQILVDESHIGTPVIEGLREINRPVLGEPFGSKTRKSLLANLIAVVQNRELIIPFKKDDPHGRDIIAKTLIEEMLAFKEVKTEATKTVTYKSEAAHDDTVMALALACKGAKKIKEAEAMGAGV